MGGVINLIKNLFSGILSFIGGILGGKKSSGYFMELDEAKSAKSEPAKAAAPAAAQATTGAAKSEPVKTEAKKPAAAKPATADLNGSTNGAKPPVPANTLNLPQPTVSFATEYLVPKPTNSRRRPGANMESFLAMAKTVKTSNN